MILRSNSYEVKHQGSNVLLTFPANTVFDNEIDRIAFKMIDHAVISLFTQEQKEELFKHLKGELE
jgi:hypothetical protein